MYSVWPMAAAGGAANGDCAPRQPCRCGHSIWRTGGVGRWHHSVVRRRQHQHSGPVSSRGSHLWQHCQHHGSTASGWQCQPGQQQWQHPQCGIYHSSAGPCDSRKHCGHHWLGHSFRRHDRDRSARPRVPSHDGQKALCCQAWDSGPVWTAAAKQELSQPDLGCYCVLVLWLQGRPPLEPRALPLP